MLVTNPLSGLPIVTLGGAAIAVPTDMADALAQAVRCSG